MLWKGCGTYIHTHTQQQQTMWILLQSFVVEGITLMCFKRRYGTLMSQPWQVWIRYVFSKRVISVCKWIWNINWRGGTLDVFVLVLFLEGNVKVWNKYGRLDVFLSLGIEVLMNMVWNYVVMIHVILPCYEYF